MNANENALLIIALVSFLSLLAVLAVPRAHAEEDSGTALTVSGVRRQEDIFQYIRRTQPKAGAKQTQRLYQRIMGAANPFKEGDLAVGDAAADEKSRENARLLLANTAVKTITEHPLYSDTQQEMIAKSIDPESYALVRKMTLCDLKKFILTKSEAEVKRICPGLNSDVIAAVVKLMSDKELVLAGQKIFNPLPGGKIGARGYFSARVQPNSPNDDPADIRWQVFDAFAFSVGDLLLGTNPVDSTPENVARIESTLKDVVETFGLKGKLPWVVLAHIDDQDRVEKMNPGITNLYFQSIAGVDSANNVYGGLSSEKMAAYAAGRTGDFGLYLETGQGSEFTNRQAHGVDMVTLESRKYGLARALKQKIATAKLVLSGGRTDNVKKNGGAAAWVAVNDVAGFIGPEVFKSKEQLLRAALEDTVMGKLHGLAIGLDICSTLHMDVSLDDLDWCIDRVAPANPAYLMALPTKNDPMLSYLTTAFQDHLRVRENHGYKVNDVMWSFFKELGVIDAAGNPTKNFGDPLWVYLQYARRKAAAGDTEFANLTDEQLLQKGREQMALVQSHGVPLAVGYGKKISDMNPALAGEVLFLYNDSKKSIWTELTPDFIENQMPKPVLRLRTRIKDRGDYILHPCNGEVLDGESEGKLRELKKSRKKNSERYDVQIVISDGLNARALMDKGHLLPYLQELRPALAQAGFKTAPENIVITGGRVRAGYRLGEQLFDGDGTTEASKPEAVIHIIGERPGNGHQTFSAYIAAPDAARWNKGGIDHNYAIVLSGVSDTTFNSMSAAARETVRLLNDLIAKNNAQTK
ncbi:MAG: ethanolamine ammonia-lyase subunit EutB [Elusimicrobiaceae bacterium]